MVPAARWVAHHELALALHVHSTPRPTHPRGGRVDPGEQLHASGWPLAARPRFGARPPGPRRYALLVAC